MLVARDDRAGLKARVVYDGADRGADRRGTDARRARGRRPRPRARSRFDLVAGADVPTRRPRRRASTPPRGSPATAPSARSARPLRAPARGMAGRFISFEGIDGSGKSTQVRLLAARAARRAATTVVETREPGGAPGAEAIRRLLVEGEPGRWSAETEILLFTAARRDHLERTIRPALAHGRDGDHRPLRRFDPRLPGRGARRAPRDGRRAPRPRRSASSPT